MGCMLRSDPMTQCDVFLQPETAFMILSRLGEVGCVQFYDLNEELNAFQRKYVIEICRCADMERKLRYIREKMNEDEIDVPKLLTDPPALELHETPPIEATIETWERILLEMSANLSNMTKSYSEMTEMSYVLTTVGEMLGDAEVRRSSGLSGLKSSKGGGQTTAGPDGGRLVVLTGLVQRKRSYSFQLMVWRLSRGNAFYKQTAEDQIFKDAAMNNVDVRKVAFLLVVQGETLGARMKKVCEGFRCDLYPIPSSHTERMSSLGQLNDRILDLSMVLKESKFHRCKEMRAMAKVYPKYLMQIKKAKAVYHTMNMFSLDITKKCLIGRCWVPTSDLPLVQDILQQCTQKLESSVPSFLSKVQSHDTPPTFHRTNIFTHGFQALINAYGESTYRELNPGLYTIITFPYLFSLMFGDLGHGTIMFFAAAWMVYNEKKFIAARSDSEIWNIFFGGRYIMLLMSIFSMYAGTIYNDCFSKAFTFYPSSWSTSLTLEELTKEETFLLEPKDSVYAYPYGKDPAWELAENKILFENSLKMKLSIIIGVTHMIFGLTLSLINDIFFRKPYLIFLEFLPQVLFLLCIFMWLVFLIFFKWFKYGGGTPASVKESQGCAPLVLILFIDMVLMSTSHPLAPECDAYMFPHQQIIQKSLLFTALVAVPIMLFGPPCYEAQANKRKKTALMRKVPDKDRNPSEFAAWEQEMEEASETFSDLMIHQAVHTIEFVLSTISHTASYLRLWALSLAHAQLSEMLWAMIFSKMALSDHSIAGAFKIVVVFGVWAFFTLAILVLMEGLSAFLHTLRLHWVEFMSKFYKGSGIVFKPFSFDILFSDQNKEKSEVCPSAKVFEY